MTALAVLAVGLTLLTATAGAGLRSCRVTAYAHYPSDVVAGFALGFLGALIVARWLGARGLGLRLEAGKLPPALRSARSWRGRPK